MYNKLISLGCSLTHHIGWADELSQCLDLPLTNLAVSSGSNYLQQKRFQELLFSEPIKKNDIIIWQITGSNRSYLRTKLYTKYMKSKRLEDKRKHFSNVQNSINIFDNQARIDFLSHSNLAIEYTNKTIEQDVEQQLEDLLFYIISAKNMTSNVYVIYGWDKVITDEYKLIFEKKLAEHNITLFPEPIVNWCHNHKLKFHPDNVHPLQESLREYTNKYLYLELKKELEVE